MSISFVTDYEMADELALDLAPKVTVACDCGTVTSYYQDAPGHRCFDPVTCDGCGKVIGKT
jgi:hypothetical protein